MKISKDRQKLLLNNIEDLIEIHRLIETLGCKPLEYSLSNELLKLIGGTFEDAGYERGYDNGYDQGLQDGREEAEDSVAKDTTQELKRTLINFIETKL